MTYDVPTLTDGTITLRRHTEADIGGIHEQCVDPLSQQWTTVPVPYELDDARSFVTERTAQGWRDGSEWAFAVEATDDVGTPRFAGTVSLRDEGDARAEVAFGSHPWVRGRGVMRRAVELLLDWGFDTMDLRTVMWRANKGNWASRRLAWRLGFSFDGTHRQWLPQRGELRDAWLGVLLAGEPRKPRSDWLDVPRITGPSVVLREHKAEDVARIVEACRDERLGYWLSVLPRPYTEQNAREYFESRSDARAVGKGVDWAVADGRTDELIANISLFDLKPADDAEIGFWTHPAAQGRGVMTEACGLVVRHAFMPVENGGLGLRRLSALAGVDNSASRKVIEANGFVETGRQRADLRLGDGTWTDTIAYDLLADEYAPKLRSVSPGFR